MNSHEIISRTLAYEYPERIAHSFAPSDFEHARCTIESQATEWRKVAGERWERTDEWGNIWGRIDPTSKGEVIRGVIQTWDDLDTYTFPIVDRPENYQSVRQVRRKAPDRWLIGHLPGFTFNIARKMRRFEQYLMDIMLERERIRILHDRIDDVLAAMIEQYAEAGVDCVMFPEDWGTQKGTLISPELWREEFYPRFCRLCDVAHTAGIKVFMHSCGQIEPIVPGLIDAGIDLLQFDQPDLHGIDTLAGRQENATITFWCPVDIQVTLQTRDREVIEAKVREMLDKLWKGRGGFVAGYYSDNESIGLDPKWQRIASEAFLRYGVQSRYA
jgi:uroporphyrinogen decarboxylase